MNTDMPSRQVNVVWYTGLGVVMVVIVTIVRCQI